MDHKLKILFVSAEVAPLAKTGGLGDVAGALPPALRRLGHDVRLAMPDYRSMDLSRYAATMTELPHPLFVAMRPGLSAEARVRGCRFQSDMPLYLLGNDHFFGRDRIYGYDDDDGRFIFLSRASLDLARHLDWSPDVIHCNDWHTAIVPNYLRVAFGHDPFLARTATVLTIHNLAYQGITRPGALAFAGLPPERFSYFEHGHVNLLARGIDLCDAVNAVSPRYAHEILTSAYGEGLQGLLNYHRGKLFGILNGIDYEEWNPAADTHLAAPYSARALDGKTVNKRALQHEMGLPENAQAPLVGFVSRLVEQKGIDLMVSTLDPLLRDHDFQLVVLASGDDRYEAFFRTLEQRWPGRVSCRIGFNASLAHRIYAGCDAFVMPSKFEPCGLAQLICLRYGTVPVVRQTGGLADTIHADNGFVFESYDGFGFYWGVQQALRHYADRKAWRALMLRGMAEDHSWESSARRYEEMYELAIRRRRAMV